MGNDSSKSKSSTSKGITSTLGIKAGPSQATVQRHIDNAQKSRILQLKSCGLKALPSSLNELHDVIRNLELSQNKLKELPPTIGAFTVLKQLHLSENALTELPHEIGMLKNLEILQVQSNKLSSLPDSLVGCTSLKTLNISANSFTQFPVVACHLMSLETLNLAQNTITELPDEQGN
ncbi:leucine Rich repeat-containing domain protein [Cooperia oncophora]